MGFLWWGRKKEDEKITNLKAEIHDSFDDVKHDMGKISKWIRHLDSKDDDQEAKIEAIYSQIGQIREDVDGIKSFVSFFDTRLASRLFKHKQELFNKQTAVQGVQTPVQTAVQTAMLRGLTGNERLIVWTMLNTDLKLSYEDIAVLLGKEKSTIRGQINNIKQKSGGLISEILERSGKKRYYVEDRVKEMMLKKAATKQANAVMNPSEQFIFDELTKTDFNPVAQFAFGTKNMDFAIPSLSIAVEVVCRGTFRLYIKNGGLAERAIELATRGWPTYILVSSDSDSIKDGGIDDMLSWFKFIKSQPSARRQYRMVRGSSNLLATGCSDCDHIASIFSPENIFQSTQWND